MVELKLQLRFDVYYKLESDEKLVIYRLVPKLTKYTLSRSSNTLHKYIDFLRALEIGEVSTSDLRDADLIAFYELLDQYHLLCEDRNIDSLNSPYLRQLEMFESWDIHDKTPEFYQKRLTESSVLVIGAGGLSTPIINMLVHIGVGHVVIIDKDTIEISNLSRQYLYTVADVGHRKVDVVAERLNQCGLGTVVPIFDWISKDNICDYIKKYNIDIVTGINVTDVVATMETLECAVCNGTPVLCVNEHSVGPFIFSQNDLNRTKNFLNRFELRQEYLNKRTVVKKREMHPSMVTDLSMVGALCADEILRFLTGISDLRLKDHAYGMDPVNFIFRQHSLDDEW